MASSAFDYLKRSSDEELTLSDWQIVGQSAEQSDDDDSIEVIEREGSASSSSLTSSESEESDSEEQFKDFTNNEAEEEEFTENRVQTIVPLNQCHSCTSCAKKTDRKTQVSMGMTSKVLYSFTFGVIASLIFHHYKSYIMENVSSFSFGNELNLADMYLSFPFAHTNFLSGKDRSVLISSSQEQNNDDDSIVRLRRLFEKEKVALDHILTKQLDLLKHARRLQNDTYVFEISTAVIDHQRIGKQILPCEDNVKSEKLPFICQNDHSFLVYVKESQIISMSNTIIRYLSDFNEKVDTWHNLLIESAQSEGTHSDTNKFIFIQDCDDFSKRYKSNSHCVGSNWYCKRTGDVKKFTTRFGMDGDENWYLVKLKSSRGKLSVEDSFSSGDGTASTKEDSRVCRCTASVDENDLTKIDGEESDMPESENYENGKNNVDGDDSTKVLDEGRKESISGEWLFDLHKARAKLRNYYDSITSGYWFVKLGKAREKQRESQNKQYRFQNDKFDKHDEVKKEYRYQNWYKKNGEKFKLKFKSLMSDWKQQFESAKESLTDKFSELKSNLKNRFRK